MEVLMITQNDIYITGWADLCEKLYMDSWNSRISRFRTDYAFRGLSNKEYRLENSFMRNCGNKADLEYHLLRNFKKYAQIGDQKQMASIWRLMTIAQHYGLPTRLLDWTYSPFIAVHFATCDVEQYDRDGVIWMVDYVSINKTLPEPLCTIRDQEKANAFTIEMLDRSMDSLNEFAQLAPEDLVIFFEPPSLDSRIINQFAFFSVMSDPVISMDDWLKNKPELYKRIIIPAELKWEIRDKLDQANITERILFPGLDGLADWLKRQYHPRT